MRKIAVLKNDEARTSVRAIPHAVYFAKSDHAARSEGLM
jgi:hypothetical protein